MSNLTVDCKESLNIDLRLLSSHDSIDSGPCEDGLPPADPGRSRLMVLESAPLEEIILILGLLLLGCLGSSWEKGF